jgi:hypothetical protein
VDSISDGQLYKQVSKDIVSDAMDTEDLEDVKL